ncbi:MAG: NADH-dependent phenylglyoxylate, partial [Chloroflexi bacterium]|nr:NADH-dependent phenylglyoxylate [Chloroflexota bacterium]
GFQALSGAAERGDNLLYICYDNEGYMNTGVQRSSSTPYGAKTATTPVGPARHGKEQVAKNMPLLMLFHEIPYVATANIAYPEDYARKLTKAMQVKDGLAYIHLFIPCITGWGIPETASLDVCRLAVETNYFPLWEAEHGKVRLTKEIAIPRPIEEYVRMIGKYSHLTDEDIQRIHEMVNERYNLLKNLSLASTAKVQT